MDNNYEEIEVMSSQAGVPPEKVKVLKSSLSQRAQFGRQEELDKQVESIKDLTRNFGKAMGFTVND